jgi:hypothetical protein
LEKNQISALFEIHGKQVQNLLEILNKSQPTLYNTSNMTVGSRKEPQKCNTLERSFSSLVIKAKFAVWHCFSTTSDLRRK